MTARSSLLGPSVRGSLTAVACSLLAAVAAPARANDHEVVFATGTTELHVRPGEAAPVVGHTDVGDELEVLGDQGRWLRVRNGKQIGWLTRTEVSTMKPAERRRARRSGFSGKPVTDAVKVTIDIDNVRGFDDPRTKAQKVLELSRGDVVTVIGRSRDGWLLVEEPEDGGVGWIPASVVSDAGKFADDPRRARSEVESTQPAAGAEAPAVKVSRRADPKPARRLSASLLATGGVQAFKMAQSGEGDPSVIASGPVITIVAGARMRVRGSLWIGAGATAANGGADLTYYGQGAPSSPTASAELAIDAYGEVGIGEMPYLAVRGGVHYRAMSVESDSTQPMLLGERIAGPTAGLGGGLPITRWLSFTASVDVMPAGAQQLARLPPDTLYATAVWGAWARGTLALPLPAHLMAGLSYQFGVLEAQLTDNGAMPKTATRSDQSHEITGGLGLRW